MVQERRGKVWNLAHRRDVRAHGARDVPDAWEHPRLGPRVRRLDRRTAVPRVPHRGAAWRVRLIAWRRESLRAEATFDTPLSRESVFLGNNILLLVLTFTVLVGTIYPCSPRPSRAGRSRIAVLQPQHGAGGAPAPVPDGDRPSCRGERRRSGGPSPPAGPDVGRRHHRGGPRAGAWPRWSCSGSRRSSRRRPSPRWSGRAGAARARALDRRRHGRRGVQEPSPVRRARGASRTDRRGRRRVVVGALGPFVGGDDHRGRDRAWRATTCVSRGSRPGMSRTDGCWSPSSRCWIRTAGERSCASSRRSTCTRRRPSRSGRRRSGSERLQRHGGPVRLARHGRGPDARLVPLLREPGDRAPVVRWRRDGARRHRCGMAVRAAAGEHTATRTGRRAPGRGVGVTADVDEIDGPDRDDDRAGPGRPARDGGWSRLVLTPIVLFAVVLAPGVSGGSPSAPERADRAAGADVLLPRLDAGGTLDLGDLEDRSSS